MFPPFAVSTRETNVSKISTQTKFVQTFTIQTTAISREETFLVNLVQKTWIVLITKNFRFGETRTESSRDFQTRRRRPSIPEEKTRKQGKVCRSLCPFVYCRSHQQNWFVTSENNLKLENREGYHDGQRYEAKQQECSSLTATLVLFSWSWRISSSRFSSHHSSWNGRWGTEKEKHSILSESNNR